MKKLKYVRLYEEYTDLEEKSLEKHYSWAEVRNTIQTKLPFIIIDFKDVESRNDCIKGELYDEKYAKQVFYKTDGGTGNIQIPSVFIFGEESDLKDRVQGFIKRFKIHRLIIGEIGKEVPSLYLEGENVDMPSDIMTSIDIKEMGADDFYKIDSTYYAFIG